MTEIEEKFFKIFGVDNCSNCDRKNSLECYYCDNKYPEITSDILLELMCILSVARKHFELAKIYTIQEMKDYILQVCIVDQEGIYTRVQSIFKGSSRNTYASGRCIEAEKALSIIEGSEDE